MTQHACDIDQYLKFIVDERKIHGTIQIQPVERTDVIDAPALIAYLEGKGVRSYALKHTRIDDLVQQVHDNPELGHEACVALGKEPEHGQDARIVYEDSISERADAIESRNSAYEQAASSGNLNEIADGADQEAIDFYNMSPFLVVNAGDPVCTIVPRVPGVDGLDIFGGSIAAKSGKDAFTVDTKSLKIVNGSIISKIAGVLSTDRDALKIDPVLEIRENVDFSTANIDFPGDVLVSGGILDNFIVKSEGNISIGKLAQASTIQSDQSITLRQGMAGKGNGVIIARRELTSGYVEAVNAVVGGNCIINHEITNSILQIGGELSSPSASVRGGEISVANHAEVAVIGSIQGVETTLQLGHLPEISTLIDQTREFVSTAEQQIATKKPALERFVQSIGKPTASQIEEQMGMEFEIAELESNLRVLDEAMHKLLRVLLKRTSVSLTTHKIIYAKSTIYLPGYKAVFVNDLEGHSIIELPPIGEPTITQGGNRRLLKEVAKVHSDQRVLRVLSEDGALRLAD